MQIPYDTINIQDEDKKGRCTAEYSIRKGAERAGTRICAKQKEHRKQAE